METPNTGGAYTRAEDGTLQRVEEPTAELPVGARLAVGVAPEPPAVGTSPAVGSGEERQRARKVPRTSEQE